MFDRGGTGLIQVSTSNFFSVCLCTIPRCASAFRYCNEAGESVDDMRETSQPELVLFLQERPGQAPRQVWPLPGASATASAGAERGFKLLRKSESQSRSTHRHPGASGYRSWDPPPLERLGWREWTERVRCVQAAAGARGVDY